MNAPIDGPETEANPPKGMIGRLARVAGAVAGRHKHWRDIAEMRSLNDAYLRDIGISRFGIGWSVPHGDTGDSAETRP